MKKRERQNTDGKSGFFVENSVRHLGCVWYCGSCCGCGLKKVVL